MCKNDACELNNTIQKLEELIETPYLNVWLRENNVNTKSC